MPAKSNSLPVLNEVDSSIPEKSLTGITLREDFLQKIVGDHSECFQAHAKDESIRKGAASGGVTSAILCELLRLGLVDGILTWHSVIEDNQVVAKPMIATDEEGILRGRTSKYTPVYLSDALRLAQSFEGTLAAVLLPCDTTKFRRVTQKRAQLTDKIKLIITLFCGHNSEAELTTRVLSRYSLEPNELESFSYRTGHWRGRLGIKTKKGFTLERPSADFLNFQNLHFFSQRKCLNCADHFGYDADISVGDIWLQKMRKDPIKHTAIMLRTDVGRKMFDACKEPLVLNKITPSDVLIGQARGSIFHFNVTARKKAGKLLGVQINDREAEEVTFFELLAALIAVFNYKISSKNSARFIFKLPIQLIRVYVLAFKGIEHWVALRAIKKNRVN